MSGYGLHAQGRTTGERMSDHATTASATPFVERIERERAPVEGGFDWPVAAALSASVLGLYTVIGAALYLLITSVT